MTGANHYLMTQQEIAIQNPYPNVFFVAFSHENPNITLPLYAGPFQTEEEAQAFRLFLIGVKPGMVLSKTANIPFYLLDKYPSVALNSRFIGSVILFQNEEVKRDFDFNFNSDGDYETKLKAQKRAIGLAAGYPPVAVQDFIDDMDIPKPEHCDIYYHGFQFVCKESHVPDCLQWMEETYTIPFEFQTKVHIRRYDQE